MVGDFPFTEDHIEFCPDKVLEQCSHVVRAATLLLEVFSLAEQVRDCMLYRSRFVEFQVQST